MSFFGFQIQCTNDAVIPGSLAQTSYTNRAISFDDTPIVPDPTPVPVITHENGVITIKQAGNFYISWFISLKTGLGDDGAQFSLVADSYSGASALLNTTFFPSTNSMKTGQLAGSALIQIDDTESCVVRLCNMNEYEATLSTNTSVKANITIHQFLVGSYSSAYGLVAMTLKLTSAGQSSTDLAYNDPVLFNLSDIPTYANTIFAYNTGTGVFTTLKGGNFLLNWSVCLDGSQDADAISFALRSTTGTQTTDIDTFDSTLIMQNSFSGFTFFQAQAGQTFTFENVSKKTDPITSAVTGADLTYSKIPTRAVLRVVGHN